MASVAQDRRGLPRSAASVLGFVDARPRLAALCCGLVAATGFPPLALWPLALLGVAGLAWLVWRSSDWKRAGLIGWLFGFSHLTLANSWIATAFTFQAKMPAALGWAAVPLLCLYLAVYPAIATGLAKALAPRASLAAFAPLLGACWIFGEWLRSWVFTGYPWPPLSLILLGDWSRPGAALALPLTGTYALSGVLVTVVTLALAALHARRWLLAALSLLVPIASMLWPAPATRNGTLPFTLVQPRLGQDEINDPSRFEEQFQRIAGLSRPQRQVPHRLILWPESAVPDYLEPGYPQIYYTDATAAGDPDFARRRIAQVGGDGSLVLTGVVNLQIGLEGTLRTATGAYNSVMAIGPGGTIAGRYDKAHLVPYGEYLPMRPLLEPLGLSRLVAGSLDFIPGPGPRTIDLGPWGKAGMQVCYEIVFSGQVVDEAHRPDYIFNPSNDGWFGTWGPPQHLAQARMRAIEEGLPVLRSTTTGISAVIDAHGVVRDHIGRGLAARIDGLVPRALPPTPFARFGVWLTAFWIVLLAAASLVASRLLAR
jgi:apolipoprotein N-acyltransferase